MTTLADRLSLTEEEKPKAIAAMMEVRRAIEFLPETSLDTFLHFSSKHPTHAFGTYLVFLMDTQPDTCFRDFPLEYTLTISKMLHLGVTDENSESDDKILMDIYVEDELTNNVAIKLMPAIYLIYRARGVAFLKEILAELMHDPSDALMYAHEVYIDAAIEFSRKKDTMSKARIKSLFAIRNSYLKLVWDKLGIWFAVDEDVAPPQQG